MSHWSAAFPIIRSLEAAKPGCVIRAVMAQHGTEPRGAESVVRNWAKRGQISRDGIAMLMALADRLDVAYTAESFESNPTLKSGRGERDDRRGRSASNGRRGGRPARGVSRPA
jgi:hypothetical protein